MELVALGSKKKSSGGATADGRAATTGIQHKHKQTTVFWGEIKPVHNRPTEATRGPHLEGKEETGVDRIPHEWWNTDVPPGAR